MGDASKPRPDFRFLPAGLELGALMFVANAAQIAGLKYTSASRAAFLIQMSTVIVPLLAATFGFERLSPRVAAGAAFALAGVALLSCTGDVAGGVAASAMALARLGDALELLAALLVSLYVLRLSHHARVAKHSTPLVAVKVITQAVLSLMWLGACALLNPATNQPVLTALPWTAVSVLCSVFMVVWCGVSVGALATWMQTKGQETVSASEASILYATQPIWATLVATMFLGESLTTAGMAGAGMIVAGTMVSSTGKR